MKMKKIISTCLASTMLLSSAGLLNVNAYDDTEAKTQFVTTQEKRQQGEQYNEDIMDPINLEEAASKKAKIKKILKWFGISLGIITVTALVGFGGHKWLQHLNAADKKYCVDPKNVDTDKCKTLKTKEEADRQLQAKKDKQEQERKEQKDKKLQGKKDRQEQDRKSKQELKDKKNAEKQDRTKKLQEDKNAKEIKDKEYCSDEKNIGTSKCKKMKAAAEKAAAEKAAAEKAAAEKAAAEKAAADKEAADKAAADKEAADKAAADKAAADKAAADKAAADKAAADKAAADKAEEDKEAVTLKMLSCKQGTSDSNCKNYKFTREQCIKIATNYANATACFTKNGLNLNEQESKDVMEYIK